MIRTHPPLCGFTGCSRTEPNFIKTLPHQPMPIPMLTTTALLDMTCQVQVSALTQIEVDALLQSTPLWQQQGQRIARTFAFADYHVTLAFINAIAYVIHAQDHHPELTVTYSRCTVRYDTHSVNGGAGGLSVNDFICAAKVDAIFLQTFS